MTVVMVTKGDKEAVGSLRKALEGDGGNGRCR
jgi:hypothetical protein